MRNYSGVEVVLGDIHSNPTCDHGPSILFERKGKDDQSNSRFYACSASRDKSICHFYLEEKSLDTHNFRSRTKEELLFHQFYKDHHDDSVFLGSKPNDVKFCKTCSILVLPNKDGEHKNCDVTWFMTKKEFDSPSLILPPLSNSKAQAQYLFSEKSRDMILKLIKELSSEKVLCIGAPRIHEALRQNESVTSLLLDIDRRYSQFFPLSEMLPYNLFNHYFFGGIDSKEIYLSFLKGCKKLTLIMDPPFGGRMELIANTLKIIDREWREVNDVLPKEKLPILLVFPYFLEKLVVSNMPSLTMLDLKVDYENHALYSQGPKGMKNGSAVRVYVNVPASTFSISDLEGYWYCDICEKWAYEDNVHCFKCGSCTSKDGRTYKHCEDCDKCVKPSWVHCFKCKKCFPADHRCQVVMKAKKQFCCHKCGALDHKRRDCPSFKEPLKRIKKHKKKGLPRSITEEKSMHKSVLEQILKSKSV